MNHRFDKSHQERTKRAWETFVATGEPAGLPVRGVILDSWVRSRAYGVDPFAVKPVVLNRNDVSARVEANRDLIDVARPYLERLYSIVEGSGFYLMAADREGCILDLIGDSEIVREGRRKSNLVVGANRNEDYAGTNAIGICLAVCEPIQIWGFEHYVKQHHIYACSAAPILGDEGDILGCLNITGLADNVHFHTLGMMLSAADGIAKELRIRKAYADIERTHTESDLILNSVMSGFVLLDQEGKVVRMNATASELLHTDESLVGAEFFDVYDIGGHAENLLDRAPLPVGEEVDYYTRGAGTPPVKLLTSVFQAGSGAARTSILKLEKLDQAHRLAGRISGFSAHFSFSDVVCESEEMRRVLALAERSAKANSNILILGESGTGKELVAQSIHRASRCAGGPFVALNCGALPRELIESELFGYEGGAFTGAAKNGRPGKFELADGGTIFFDEIGDMPLDVQTALLRVIETREITRLSGRYSKSIDVRIIAATNRDLGALARGGLFRKDLYYRLNVMPIVLPPLRERKGDVPVLAERFVRAKSSAAEGVNAGSRLSAEAMDLLKLWHWPGNVRELENVIERAVYLSTDGVILPEHLPDALLAEADASGRGPANADLTDAHAPAAEGLSHSPHAAAYTRPNLNLKAIEREAITRALAESGGNITKAAKSLGVSRRTLHRKLARKSSSQS